MAGVLREMFGLDEAGANLVIHAFKNGERSITVSMQVAKRRSGGPRGIA